jgi:predicted flap endonuclease-1-like 5' DNA nuclease
MSKKAKPRSGGEFPPGVAKPAQRALASIGVTRLDQVTRFSRSELSALHGMGPKALRLIEEALRAQGKALAKDG